MRIRSASELGAVVKGRRKDLGLSQAEVAGRAGIARKSIVELEAGATQPELRLTLRVLESLGLSLTVEPTPQRRPKKRGLDLDALLSEHRRK